MAQLPSFIVALVKQRQAISLQQTAGVVQLHLDPSENSSRLRRSQFPRYALLALLLAALAAHAQDGEEQPGVRTASSVFDGRNPKVLLKHLASDQLRLWSSPARVKHSDAAWLIPMAGITTGLIMIDRTAGHEMSRGNHESFSNDFSNFGLVAYGGTMAGFYVFGRRDGDLKREETGLLAGEAGINALAVNSVLKYVFQRQRPAEGDGKGHFFRPVATSFPSSHATIAWSFASVVASEYPGWLSKTLAYGGATAISLSRVTAEKHWPSDVFVGSVTGYLIGKNVYKTWHDSAIDQSYGVFVHGKPEWSSGNAGTTYVPLDSWVYPVFDRLAALGFIRYGYAGLRPYARTAAADMVAEALGKLADSRAKPAGVEFDVLRLQEEFAPELGMKDSDNEAIHLDSLYTRSLYITGRPLNDSYHFGQSIINDYGRPYQRGFNNVTGFRARAEMGRFAFYVNGEYQHAPGASPYPLDVRELIARIDVNPVLPGKPFAEVSQFRLLDTYASMTLLGHSVAVGKQSLWWGPALGGAMIMSNNAEPIYMLQVNRTIPLKIPGLSKAIGPIRYDFFFGKLSGHHFPPDPYMHGEKISFKPTQNLEFGFSRTAVWAGQGITPLTFGTFWTSFTSTTSSTGLAASDFRNSPGARHGQFDFSYRVPGLRNWLTIYSDSVVHDDISPIDAPRRAAINPGFYLSHVPGMPKLDLRVEAVNTDPPISKSIAGSFFYWEVIYHDLYLNKQNLLGSWIGREGKGVQAWSTYWLSPFNQVQFEYRNAKISKDFIPEGETLNSFKAAGTFRLKSEFQLSTSVQYDRWTAPALAPGLQSNLITGIELTYFPKKWSFSSRDQK